MSGSNHISVYASILMFDFFVPIRLLGANFLYCAEITPLRLRMAMASISTANHWLWNFVVIMITPVASESLGYIVLASIGVTIPPVVYLFYPETMGRNLEKIDLIFRVAPSIWSTVGHARKWPVGMASEYVDKTQPYIEELEGKSE